MTQVSARRAKHPTWDTVAIVGVGLIGGSIGIDLLRRGLAKHVVGIGRREESLRAAREVGACTSTTMDLPRGLADAHLIIVCTPVGRIAQDVGEAAGFAKIGALITDVGSTKGTIVGELDRELPHEAITSAAILWPAAKKRGRQQRWPACSRDARPWSRRAR